MGIPSGVGPGGAGCTKGMYECMLDAPLRWVLLELGELSWDHTQRTPILLTPIPKATHAYFFLGPPILEAYFDTHLCYFKAFLKINFRTRR